MPRFLDIFWEKQQNKFYHKKWDIFNILSQNFLFWPKTALWPCNNNTVGYQESQGVPNGDAKYMGIPTCYDDDGLNLSVLWSHVSPSWTTKGKMDDILLSRQGTLQIELISMTAFGLYMITVLWLVRVMPQHDLKHHLVCTTSITFTCLSSITFKLSLKTTGFFSWIFFSCITCYMWY